MEKLTVPATLDSLATIRSFVDRVAVEAGLDRRSGYRLRLAVDEIATNIILYGYDAARRSGDIDLLASTDDAWLTVTLEDTAEPFDPTEAAPPDNLDDPLEQRPVGGLGIFLTVTGIDHFSYEHAEGRNRNVFGMRLAAPSGDGVAP